MPRITRRELLAAAPAAAGVAAVLVGAAAVHAAPSATGASIDQPHMGAALDALRTAKKELDIAVADKGGHRVKAIGLVKDAIAEVERGIEYDRKH